jgi:hypothetical protein
MLAADGCGTLRWDKTGKVARWASARTTCSPHASSPTVKRSSGTRERSRPGSRRRRASVQELEAKVGAAQHEDRVKLGDALIDGAKPPAASTAKARAELDQAKAELEALPYAEQRCAAQLDRLPKEHKSDWSRKTEHDLQAAGLRYSIAIQQLADARAALVDLAALLGFLGLGGTQPAPIGDGVRIGVDEVGAPRIVAFTTITTALEDETTQAAVNSQVDPNRRVPEPRIEMTTTRSGGGWFSKWPSPRESQALLVWASDAVRAASPAPPHKRLRPGGRSTPAAGSCSANPSGHGTATSASSPAQTATDDWRCITFNQSATAGRCSTHRTSPSLPTSPPTDREAITRPQTPRTDRTQRANMTRFFGDSTGSVRASFSRETLASADNATLGRLLRRSPNS